MLLPRDANQFIHRLDNNGWRELTPGRYHSWFNKNGRWECCIDWRTRQVTFYPNYFWRYTIKEE
jgi:hypothetical protein